MVNREEWTCTKQKYKIVFEKSFKERYFKTSKELKRKFFN